MRELAVGPWPEETDDMSQKFLRKISASEALKCKSTEDVDHVRLGISLNVSAISIQRSWRTSQ